jgi:hypothetical protein
MQLPVDFPTDFQVIAEEAERFRALSSKDRLEAVRGLLLAGELAIQKSPRSAFLKEYAVQQECEQRSAIMEFIARHGR